MQIPRTAIALLTCLTLVSVSTPIHAQTAAKPDTVRLRFGWRPGMQAWVDYKTSRTRVGGGRDLRTQAAFKWRLSVNAHEGGLAVRTDSVRFVGAPGGVPAEALAQRLAVMAPVYLVSKEGEFIGLQDVAGFRASMAALVDSLLATTPDVPADARATFDRIYSEAVVQATAAESWNAMVGSWMLGDLEVGELYVAEMSAPSPVMPQVEIPLALEFSVVKRLPCQKSERLDCVEITLSSQPDSIKAREAMAKFIASLGATGSEQLQAAIQGARSEARLTAVMRPDGLRPESVDVTKRVTVSGEEAGKRVTLVQDDVKTYRFRWLK